MTLSEAQKELDRLRNVTEGQIIDLPRAVVAIATILNAVVKGELCQKPEPRKAILNRYAMRNGHTKEQRPDESREDYNMRVYGLDEGDFK